VIKIKNIHNHSTDSIVTLHYLPASADCREAFIEYFSGGMGVAEAIKYHANVLRLRKDFTESQLDDGSINPKQRTVYYWYGQWRRQRIGAETGHLFNSLVKVCMTCDLMVGSSRTLLALEDGSSTKQWSRPWSSLFLALVSKATCLKGLGLEHYWLWPWSWP